MRSTSQRHISGRSASHHIHKKHTSRFEFGFQECKFKRSIGIPTKRVWPGNYCEHTVFTRHRIALLILVHTLAKRIACGVDVALHCLVQFIQRKPCLNKLTSIKCALQEHIRKTYNLRQKLRWRHRVRQDHLSSRGESRCRCGCRCQDLPTDRVLRGANRFDRVRHCRTQVKSARKRSCPYRELDRTGDPWCDDLALLKRNTQEPAATSTFYWIEWTFQNFGLWAVKKVGISPSMFRSSTSRKDSCVNCSVGFRYTVTQYLPVIFTKVRQIYEFSWRIICESQALELKYARKGRRHTDKRCKVYFRRLFFMLKVQRMCFTKFDYCRELALEIQFLQPTTA